VFSAEQNKPQMPQTNNKNMTTTTHPVGLDVVTVNFLKAIEDANVQCDSKNFSLTNEITLRVRLRESFEDYFSTLIPLETKEGFEATERSREVIQDAIAEFMESESQFIRMSECALDLDNFSKVLTESVIHTAATV
jgi:hypothetical protein